MPRWAAKTDRSHKPIVQALRKVGCKVVSLARFGDGVPDLLVRVGSRVVLIEVKEPKGKLRPDQEAFLRDWPETIIVRSVSDALRAVGVAVPAPPETTIAPQTGTRTGRARKRRDAAERGRDTASES